MSLGEDLLRANKVATERPCVACDWLARDDVPNGTKDEVMWGLRSNIGVNTLVEIFRAHGVPIGRRAIERHRSHQEA